MTGQVAHDVLRRMVSPPPPAPEDVPITSSRAVRLAITRAADKTHNCALSVAALREEVLSLDGALDALDPALMLIAMTQDGRMTGLAALDLNMRAALIELQTIGKILDEAPEERVPTGTDAKMAEPLIGSFLSHLEITAERTPLDGWGIGFEVGDKVSSTRAAGLVLDEGNYRVIRLTLDLGVADRQAELTFALPNGADATVPVEEPEELGDWATRFQTVLNSSNAELDAVLHRFKLTLHQAETLEVGQVLPLPGCTVSSVKLVAKDGRKIATARLGQSGGMKAVRIEAAPQAGMTDMDNLSNRAGAMGGLPPLDEPAFGMGGGTPSFDMAGDAGGEESFDADAPSFDMGDAPMMDMNLDGDGGDTPEIDMSMPMAAPMDMGEAADDTTPAPLSWDDEDL